MNDTIPRLKSAYGELLDEQQFDEGSLDYSFFEKQRGILNELSEVGHSGISIFDCFKREHIFYSLNFGGLLGYDVKVIEQEGLDFMESKIHPDDYGTLLQNSILAMRLLFAFSADEKYNYKFISEFRLQNASGKYLRMIEQHQVFKLDNAGNIWLSLSIIDVSPNQHKTNKVSSRLLNFRAGNIISLPASEAKRKHQHELTKREQEILQLVKDGLLSKEISDKLSISVHTVNTHRQRVLEKLGVNNSIEAIILASKLGLLD